MDLPETDRENSVAALDSMNEGNYLHPVSDEVHLARILAGSQMAVDLAVKALCRVQVRPDALD